MKKVVMMLVMLFTMSVYSFADNNEATKINNVEKYELKINHKKLACVLDLNEDQMESMDWILSDFENNMLYLASIDDDESRNKILLNVINNNVKYMNFILNEKQYKKYLVLLNTTLNNRNIVVKDEKKGK